MWHCYSVYHIGKRCWISHARPILEEQRLMCLVITPGLDVDKPLLPASFDLRLLTISRNCRSIHATIAQNMAVGYGKPSCNEERREEGGADVAKARAAESATLRAELNRLLDGYAVLSRDLRESAVVEVQLTPTRSAFLVNKPEKAFADLGKRQQQQRRAPLLHIMAFLNTDDETAVSSFLGVLRRAALKPRPGHTERGGELHRLKETLQLLGSDDVLNRMFSLVTEPVAQTLTKEN